MLLGMTEGEGLLGMTRGEGDCLHASPRLNGYYSHEVLTCQLGEHIITGRNSDIEHDTTLTTNIAGTTWAMARAMPQPPFRTLKRE